MLPPFDIDQSITRIVREEWGRILAALVARLGDLQLAEDVLQDAVVQALSTWANRGIPDSPAAWLIATANNKAIDILRRSSRFAALKPELKYLTELESPATEPEDLQPLPDKRLELIFTCCHPALDEKSRIALTLRTLGGLTTEEIAKAYLDKPKTMAQRLTRAKSKIKLAGIAFQIPANDQLQQRLNAVLAVIYLIFNEGYSATSGDQIVRSDLSNEAIRLARIIHSLLPEETEVAGLLSLMLLHDSRTPARRGRNNEIISLQDQHRSKWSKDKICEGTTLLKDTLRQQKVGTYQVQAAISALHAEAETWDTTDWQQINALYELLYSINPTPVVRINQSMAISYAQTPKKALETLKTIESDPSIKTYQPFFAARADLHARAGNHEEAREDLKTAIGLSENTAQTDFLRKKLERIPNNTQ